jgi:Glycosyl transferase family 2
LARVTCICTAYNVGAYVRAAISSALAQDYRGELEIVAVNDGSTDDTGAILDAFGDRITVVHQANTGFLGAVNAGLAAATGDYIALLDGDDVWPEDKVRRQAEYLDAHPEVGLVFGDMEVIDGHGALLHESFWQFERLEVFRGDIFDRLVQGNFVSGGASMFRAAHRERFAPIPEDVAWPDWWLAVRIAEVARVDWIDGPMNRYRLHGSNMGFRAGGPRFARNRREEIRMRRWILQNLSDSRAPLSRLLACHQVLELQAAQAASAAGGLPTDGIPVDDADRERSAAAQAEARRLAEGGDGEAAARQLLRALGHDPWDGRGRIELYWLVEAIGGAAALAETGRPLPELAPTPEVGGFCAVADGDELAHDPALLRAFADAFTPSDDATLLVLGPGDTAGSLETKMLDALVAAGLDEDACPDLLLVPGAGPNGVSAAAQAVLCSRGGPAGFESLPRAADSARLRELARLAWSA